MIRLGIESLRTYRAAERHLRRGKSVSFVGHGPSMYPIIPDGTRMHFIPYRNQEITPGMPLFVRFSERHYSCHMVWMISHNGYMLIGSSMGGLEGWVTPDQIIGVYAGAVD